MIEAAVRRLAVGGALLVASATLSCHARIPRLVAQGRYEEAIERAEDGRRRPKGKAARAWAEALVQEGRESEAQAVLLQDFRRGGEIASLVALADLEREGGFDGLAAVHYARAAELDPRSIAGRSDVCALFSRRAEVLLALGHALMAEEDIERAEAACGASERAGEDAKRKRLVQTIDRAADAEVRARAAGARCREAACAETDGRERIADLEATLVAALDGPPAHLRETATALEVQLPPAAVARLLLAEVRGELGDWILPDDELRGFVGDQGWGAFAPVVSSMKDADAAWVQLRLASVMPDLPLPPSPRVGPSTQEKWMDQVQLAPDVQAWRMHLWQGDLPAAELSLAARFRPVRSAPTSEEGLSAATPSAVGPSHWGARVELDGESLPAMLLLARLRQAAGHEDLGLELARHVLARAQTAEVPGTIRAAGDEAVHALAFGRPWSALALLDGLNAAELAPVTRAAASAVLLSRAFCGGACRDDSDAALVERVMGDAWVASTLARLPGLALQEPTGAVAEDGCPSVATLLGSDATGDLAEAVGRARADLHAPELGNALASAIASDLGLWCTGRVALPIMASIKAELAAARLAESLAHAPQMQWSSALELLAGLALVAGQGERAELTSRAAAGASADPAGTWLRIARLAHASHDREQELEALREVILHSPSLQHAGARRALVVAALRDVTRDASVGAEVDRESLARVVEEYLREHAPAQRWALTEALVERVSTAGWATPPVRRKLADVLLPEEARQRHPVALARLQGGAPVAFGPHDGSMLAMGIASRRQALMPAATLVSAEAAAMEPARLATARHARDWSVRWRMAVAVAAYGSPRSRATAIGALLEMADGAPDRRRALEELVARRPAALEPALPGGDGLPRPTAMVDDPDLLLRLLLELDLEPAWVAR